MLQSNLDWIAKRAGLFGLPNRSTDDLAVDEPDVVVVGLGRDQQLIELVVGGEDDADGAVLAGAEEGGRVQLDGVLRLLPGLQGFQGWKPLRYLATPRLKYSDTQH